MQYEEALRLWGARRLEAVHSNNRWPVVIDPTSVYVELNFNQGYACCGGTDPLCYCSFAESPSVTIEIKGWNDEYTRQYTDSISADQFDFVKFLGEVLEVSGGMIQQ